MNYDVVVIADENDADYLTQITTVTSEDSSRIKLICTLIGTSHGNWNTSEYGGLDPSSKHANILSKEDIEFFNGLVPYGENGVHTVRSVYCYPSSSRIRIM